MPAAPDDDDVYPFLEAAEFIVDILRLNYSFVRARID